MTIRPTSTRPQPAAARRFAAAIPVLIAASLTSALVSGCSFSWDDSGIKDVLLGNRRPADIVKGEEQQGTSATAEADPLAEQASPPAPRPEDQGDEESSLRRIAILPVAYSDGSGGQPCDVCPPSVAMKSTSAMSARLVTGFIYEAVARHPRFLFPSPETVEKTMAATAGRSFRQATTALASAGRADVVIAPALIELRPRVGPDDAPTQPAGVALYIALLDGRSGAILWSETFDQDESGRGWSMSLYDRVMGDRPVRWHTAEGFSEVAADELVEELVDELD